MHGHVFVMPARLEAWRRDCPFSSITSVQDVGQVVWFSKPKYNPETFAHVFSCLDIHNLITNCRVEVCKDGFPEREVQKQAWIDVARSGLTNLTVPHVEDLVEVIQLQEKHFQSMLKKL